MTFEVEVKARVGDPDALRVRLRECGEYRGFFEKEDLYFSRQGENNTLFRIRREPEGNTVTYKEKNVDSAGVEKNREHQFEVDDYLEFVKFAGYLGYVGYCEKQKKGELFLYRGANVELTLVKNLGWYIEIECLVERNEDVEPARNNVLGILADLGIPASSVEPRYYTDMLMEPAEAPGSEE